MKITPRSGRNIAGFSILLVVLLLIAGCTQQAPAPANTTTQAGMPNPASVFCEKSGGMLEIRKDAAGGEYGMCRFANGTSCEEWALYRGEGCKAGVNESPSLGSAGMANPASVSCGKNGGKTEIRKDPTGGEYGMCTFPNGTSCEEWALFRGEGCKAGTEPAGKKMVTLTESDDGKTVSIAQNTRFAIQLRENPTTGFSWNATVTPGLVIQSSDYQQDKAAPGMVGVGGTRTWIILANETGTQKFSAVYSRSWEPVTGNETSFSADIRVEKI